MLDLETIQLIEQIRMDLVGSGNTFNENCRLYRALEVLLDAHLPELLTLAKKGLNA